MMQADHVLFVFLDGVGLGNHDPAANHFAALSLHAFERLAGGYPWTLNTPTLHHPGHVFRPIDATLGVEGLPQSGTGQTTLLTGANAASVAGRHFGPFPHSKTRALLAERNIFRQVQMLFPEDSEPAAFANAFPKQFFEQMRKRNRWTVTTRACIDAGIYIRTDDDLEASSALSADITGAGWPGRAISAVSEYEAARRLVALSNSYRFTLFEYFWTDKAGHSQDSNRAAAVLRTLDGFFAGLLDTFDTGRNLLVVTSDHGNLEDLSTKTHTRNPVPLIALGVGASHFIDVHDLTGITPAILNALRPNSSPG